MEPWRAFTTCPVVGGCANSIVCTRVIKLTGVPALSVWVASLLGSTLIIALAANRLRFQDSLTVLISFASEASVTSTGHYSQGKLIFHFAVCVVGTGPEFQTGVEASWVTSSVYACMLAWAVSINPTLRLRCFWDCKKYICNATFLLINSRICDF